MKTPRYLALLLCLVCITAMAQIVNPVSWQKSVKMTDDKHGAVTFTATIEPGWHMYGDKLPDGGPNPLTVKWDKLDGVKLVGDLTPNKKPVTKHDETFGMNLSWWTGSVALTQRFEVTGEKYNIVGEIRSQACNDQECTPPTGESFSFTGTAAAKPDDAPVEEDQVTEPEAIASDSANAEVAPTADTWAPVDFSTSRIQSADAVSQQQSSSLWYIFWACFLGGLLALLTPCVWPMIPLTVSFFLKKSGSRSKSIKNALLYGLSIIVIFIVLGVLFTAIFGASALNALATSAVANIIFFLLLVVFAISFFGAFEIKLPDSWSNKMDRSAEKTTGLFSIFFMAATLVIVSFSCTGPIIGTLLVEAASQGNLMGPAVGMLGFAIALAIPFALFALFPSVLKKLPKSGGWLNTVKVVLGFIELALSLKFLSVADLAYGWHILDRETFLALWIAIFGLLGLYLLGMFRFKSDDEPKGGIGVFRFFLALISLAFTAYLVPGLWGAPLKATSAFVPPLYTQDFNLYGSAELEYDDFDAGMKAAALQGKPVFIDFSGYGCVNCRKMEAAVLDDEQVKQLIHDNFVTIRLMVDDKTDLKTPIFVQENGKNVKLSTVGDKWSYLQRHKFGSNSQPYYVTLDAQGNLISGPFAYDENIETFTRFLKAAL